ncbi:MAG: alpha/beta hydrolase family protein [Phycisphaerales bacterium]
MSDPLGQIPPPPPGGRFAELPSSLAKQARFEKLARETTQGVPALLAHPNWERPAPTVIWMHGRTVSKELDPGRYLRWVRAGMAAVALDLPGHGERFDRALNSPDNTLRVVEQMLGELDHVVDALGDPKWNGVFDLDRLAIGGMSAGGMVTLRRLGSQHPFKAAAVESTAGDFSFMRFYDQRYPRELIENLDPIRHADGWSATPLLALHSEADEWVPVDAIRSLFAALETRYSDLGADAADLLTLKTWPVTGAPYEHAGFGKVANDAKNAQVEFLTRWLRP